MHASILFHTAIKFLFLSIHFFQRPSLEYSMYVNVFFFFFFFFFFFEKPLEIIATVVLIQF